MKDLVRFQTILADLIHWGHIHPTAIYGENHVDWSYDAEGRRRVVRAAVACRLADVSATLENVLSYEVDLLRYAMELECDIVNDHMRDFPMISLGQEVAQKVRDDIWKQFTDLEYVDNRWLCQALKGSPDWDVLEAEYEELELDHEDAHAIRDAEQAAAARRAM